MGNRRFEMHEYRHIVFRTQLPLSDDYLYYDEEHPVEDPDFSREALSS